MRAYRQKADSHIDIDDIRDDIEVVMMVSGKLCLITSSTKPIEGFQRIPLQRALDFADRDSTSWSRPRTATKGKQVLKELREDMVSSLSSIVQTPIVSALTGIDTKSGKKTLVDAKRVRNNKKERIRRLEEG